MFKKLFALWFMSLVFSLTAFGFSEDSLSAVEYAKYGTNYAEESLGERLNRLETDYFGMAQSGDIESRISNLMKINSGRKNGVNLPYDRNYYNNYNNYNTKKKSSIIRSLWDNLSSGFSDNGYITGYTPSMNYSSSSGYNTLYGNTPFGYMNNMPSFCPYDNGFHNRNSLRNREYFNKRYLNNSFYDTPGSFNGVNRFIAHEPPHGKRFNSQNYRHYHRHNHPYNSLNNPYNRPYTNRTTYYSPPHIETGTSVHILRD